MNKKKKSTNISPYPDEVIDRLARAFYPAILACWNSEEGQREFAAWQAEQAHHTTSKEKQSVPDGERPAVHIAGILFQISPLCAVLSSGNSLNFEVFQSSKRCQKPPGGFQWPHNVTKHLTIFIDCFKRFKSLCM